MTNEEIITKIVEQDEDFCIMADEVNETVNIEVSLDWWKKQSNSDEDCISRKAVLSIFNKYFLGYDVVQYSDAIDEIEELPSIQPKAKVGHWIVVETEYGKRLKCDKCEHYTDIGLDRKFCPNCGAKMEDYDET